VKLVKTLWVALFLQLGILGSGWAQQITYSGKNIPLQNLFSEISRQTGYYFAYKPEVMELFVNIDLNVKNASLREVLDLCCNNTSLSYNIVLSAPPESTGQSATAAAGLPLPWKAMLPNLLFLP